MQLTWGSTRRRGPASRCTRRSLQRMWELRLADVMKHTFSHWASSSPVKAGPRAGGTCTFSAVQRPQPATDNNASPESPVSRASATPGIDAALGVSGATLLMNMNGTCNHKLITPLENSLFARVNVTGYSAKAEFQGRLSACFIVHGEKIHLLTLFDGHSNARHLERLYIAWSFVFKHDALRRHSNRREGHSFTGCWNDRYISLLSPL